MTTLKVEGAVGALVQEAVGITVLRAVRAVLVQACYMAEVGQRPAAVVVAPVAGVGAVAELCLIAILLQ